MLWYSDRISNFYICSENLIYLEHSSGTWATYLPVHSASVNTVRQFLHPSWNINHFDDIYMKKCHVLYIYISEDRSIIVSAITLLAHDVNNLFLIPWRIIGPNFKNALWCLAQLSTIITNEAIHRTGTYCGIRFYSPFSKCLIHTCSFCDFDSRITESVMHVINNGLSLLPSALQSQ